MKNKASIILISALFLSFLVTACSDDKYDIKRIEHSDGTYTLQVEDTINGRPITALLKVTPSPQKSNDVLHFEYLYNESRDGNRNSDSKETSIVTPSSIDSGEYFISDINARRFYTLLTKKYKNEH